MAGTEKETDQHDLLAFPTISGQSHGCVPHRPQNDLSLRGVLPVDIEVRQLAVQYTSQLPIWNRLRKASAKAQPSTKSILEAVTAHMPAGSLTAIIGGSGSGKTTLLNTIAHRVASSKLKVTGQVTFNGQPELRAVKSSYVMQQDILLPTLTVRETLGYSADLRLASPSNPEERQAIVESVIRELGLIECADTKIGTSIHRGCSGGEKRRTSIGVQMLANPSVLFCDEPTTGLDAHSAFQVIQTLKKLAEQGRTVIISIHSPRSEIWTLFDRLILLSRGYTLYSGPANDALTHFQEYGFEPPAFVNPAEFLIDLAAIDNRSEELEKISYSRVIKLKDAWTAKLKAMDQNEKGLVTPATSSNEKISGVAKPRKYVQVDELRNEETCGDAPATSFFLGTESSPNDTSYCTPMKEVSIVNSKDERVGFGRQVRALTRRGTKVAIRDPMGVAGTLGEAVLMGVITGWIFFKIGKDQAGIRSREGALWTAPSIQSYLLLLIEVYRLTIDMQLFDRERAEGAVGVIPFLLSRRLSRALIEDLPVPIIYSVIFYFMAGFRAEASTFFIFLTLMIIEQYIIMTAAALCVAISRDFTAASLAANLIFTLQSFAGGYFVQADQIAIWLRWTKWTTFMYYVFGALLYNEFIGVDGGKLGQTYDCPYSNINSAECQPYTGRYVMGSLGMPSDWLWRPIVVAIAFVFAFFLGNAVILTYWKRDIGIASVHKKEEDGPPPNVVTLTRSTQSMRPVTVALDQYRLDVQIRHLWKAKRTKTILNPVTARFEPGRINVIMGPSGSGKTSLLQSLAQRLKGNIFSRYLSTGSLTLNGATASANVISSITSFVTQDDDALMPSLTVRETLRFAAGLRLPSWMSKAEKLQRAEDVMLKMGLKDCADRLIGSDLKKGISGGEKRRVSIAIQILTNPRVLLLDECTSGLDTFTASSVIEALRTLADEGRTIIMTIHQARSDLFKTFDNVLLLTRGGHVAYSGPGDGMLSYFKNNLTLECPETTNPADFVLDHITVDLQQQEREAISREKVQRIIHEWGSVQQLPSEPNPAAATIATPAELDSLKRQMNPFRITFPIVLQRSAINIRRNPEIITARVMQVFGISIVIGCFFAPLQNNYEAIQSRMGLVQEFSSLYFVGMLQNLAVYPSDRQTYYQDHTDTCYTSTTFLLSYTLLEIPFEILSSLLFGLLVVLAANLRRTATMFFVAALNCFCIVSCGESVGIVFCTIFASHVGFAVNVTSTFLSIASIMGGIFSLHIPGFLHALNYLSPVKWMIGSLAAFSMEGQTFTCSAAQMVNGKCPIATGKEALQLYHLDVNGGMYLGVLVGVTVAYRVVAWAVLWAAKR